jgi:hypothetical protein
VLGSPGTALPLSLHPNLGVLVNAVEGFFAKLTSKRLKRGVFSGIVDHLQAAINRFLVEANELPQPSFGPQDPVGIIEKVRRGTRGSGVSR